MNWKRIIFLGIFSLLCLCRIGVSQTPSFSSLKLQEFCKLVGSDNAKLSETEIVQKNICLFYVSGVLDGYQLGESSIKICSPDEATMGELALVVLKHLNDHPEKLHNPPRYLILEALNNAFPCKTEPARKK